MAENLFLGLPPPSAIPVAVEQTPSTSIKKDSSPLPAPIAAPVPALKSSLKRDKPPESQTEAPQKRLRFKTTTDATETQVVEAMQKIASHIKNPSKFSKASKLALQLIQAGSVTPGTSSHFFDLLESAMSSSAAYADPSLRADYQSLFSAAQNATEYFSKQQKNELTTWTLRAVVANDLYTDDSFVFSKAAGKIKEAISSLPSTSGDDDTEEAASLAKAEKEVVEIDSEDSKNASATISPQPNGEAADPFGLDALLPSSSKKDEKSREKKDIADSKQKEQEEESKRFYKSQREALITCLEIAARRYKIPWAQTVIDILVKHAYDNIHRFTSRQREAIEKLWASIHEQLIRRKQGKSVTGKLDMNAFEWLQEKYANEKISIRHAVGGSGARRAEQWLG